MKVEGTIPSYAAGTLFRTGLGVRDVKTDKGNTYRVNHWFDNLSQVHRFQIHPPEKEDDQVRVTYNSRSTSDGLIANIKATGKRDGFTFGAKYDPCMSVFQKFSGLFKPRRLAKKADDLSVSVTLSVNFPGLSETGMKTSKPHDKSAIQTLCNKSDNEIFQMLNPETLEPIGFAYQKTLNPILKGPISATHAEVDPNTGDVYNYNMDFVKGQGLYRIFHVSSSTAKTSVLSTFSSDAAYIHSLFITANHVILCIWNSVYTCGGATILWNKNIVDSIAPYDATRKCKWYVIDKKPVEEGGRGMIASYESDPFFCFHTVNAYEETGKDGKLNIVADLVAYTDLDVIKRLYIDNLLSTSPNAEKSAKAENCHGELRRFTLPSIPVKGKDSNSTRSQNPIFLKAISGFITTKYHAPELPTISPLVTTKKHKYIYGLVHSGKSTLFEALIKFDVDTQTATTWSQHGHTAGEPIFVPDPKGDGEEDDGVLLSVVLDGPAGKSYLLVLDAKDMTEVARAHIDGIIGFGFHGTFVKK